MKDFIDISDFSADQLRAMLRRTMQDKALQKTGKLPASLPHKTLAMIFEKPSLRTRVSFETAMTHLGGHAIYLTPEDIGLGTREPVNDVARVLGRMCDGIMARTYSHQTVRELGRLAAVPVINALTDYSHPCQAMGDFLTVIEQFGSLDGRTIAFVGDGNNVARSLANGCRLLGAKFVLAAPKGYELKDEAGANLPAGACFETVHDPAKAVASADVVYADTWVSMGQEDERDTRIRDFKGFQVNAGLLAKAPRHAIVLHCLPAYRGYEITGDVFEAHADVIFRQSENRLHFQRSLLNLLIGEGGIA